MSGLAADQTSRDSPIVLALDTSSKLTSLAVARGGRLAGRFGAQLNGGRSERLWGEVEFLLGEVGIEASDVDLFAVCVGPGGFTGVRVGIAAAKGFAAAAGRPMAGVTSLESVAYAAGPAPSVCVLLHAYRGEVYAQQFTFDADGLPLAVADPAVAAPEIVLDGLAPSAGLVFAGNWAEENVEMIEAHIGGRSGLPGTVVEAGRRVRRTCPFLADHIALLASMRHERGEVQSPAGVKAAYVRPADARIPSGRRR